MADSVDCALELFDDPRRGGDRAKILNAKISLLSRYLVSECRAFLRILKTIVVLAAGSLAILRWVVQVARDHGVSYAILKVRNSFSNVNIVNQVRFVLALWTIVGWQFIWRFPVSLIKNLSPYIAGSFTAQARARIIIYHYQSMKNIVCADFMRRILQSPISLWQHGKNGCVAEIALTLPKHNSREGDLLLMLSLNGRKLAEMSFSLMSAAEINNMPSKRVLVIGQVQGRADSRDNFRLCSAMCFGVAPLNLLMSGMQTLATLLGAHSIVGVGDEAQLEGANGQSSRVYFSYDRFWSGYGGSISSSGFYDIPVPFTRKLLQDFSSKRRLQLRRRRDFKDQLAKAVTDNFFARCVSNEAARNRSVSINTAGSD